MIVLTMGVSGVGKSTLGGAIAQRLGWRFIEADELHPAANVAKMRAGQPLTDADRAPWLDALADRLRQQSAANRDAVLACSALKRAYREQLRAACHDWRIVYLQGREDRIRQRLQARRGHFMPPALLASQFAALEEPAPDEHALVLDADERPERNVARALDFIRAGLAAPRRP